MTARMSNSGIKLRRMDTCIAEENLDKEQKG